MLIFWGVCVYHDNCPSPRPPTLIFCFLPHPVQDLFTRGKNRRVHPESFWFGSQGWLRPLRCSKNGAQVSNTYQAGGDFLDQARRLHVQQGTNWRKPGFTGWIARIFVHSFNWGQNIYKIFPAGDFILSRWVRLMLNWWFKLLRFPPCEGLGFLGTPLQFQNADPNHKFTTSWGAQDVWSTSRRLFEEIQQLQHVLGLKTFILSIMEWSSAP